MWSIRARWRPPHSHSYSAGENSATPPNDRVRRRILPQSLPDMSMRVFSRGLPMAYKRTEVAIEKIIASCDGNMRGALEALMLVNEHLEEELHRLYTIMSLGDEGEEYRFETVH
jgi:hypothetical protein